MPTFHIASVASPKKRVIGACTHTLAGVYIKTNVSLAKDVFKAITLQGTY